MLFANAAPKATRKPIATRVAGSAVLRISAAFEAMKRFDGPANGIMLNPKEVSRTSINSMIEAIPTLLFLNHGAKGELEFIRVRKAFSGLTNEN
jgi:hypothetical protein